MLHWEDEDEALGEWRKENSNVFLLILLIEEVSVYVCLWDKKEALRVSDKSCHVVRTLQSLHGNGRASSKRGEVCEGSCGALH